MRNKIPRQHFAQTSSARQVLTLQLSDCMESCMLLAEVSIGDPSKSHQGGSGASKQFSLECHCFSLVEKMISPIVYHSYWEQSHVWVESNAAYNFQCDKMLEKQHKFFQKLPKNKHRSLYLKSYVSQNSPKVIKHFGYFFLKYAANNFQKQLTLVTLIPFYISH